MSAGFKAKRFLLVQQDTVDFIAILSSLFRQKWMTGFTYEFIKKRTRPMETNKDILKLGNSRFQLILRMLQQVQEQMKL